MSNKDKKSTSMITFTSTREILNFCVYLLTYISFFRLFSTLYVYYYYYIAHQTSH